MKVVMITGANRGLGLELTKRLLSPIKHKEDGMVIACSRHMSKELEELNKQPHLHHVELDITSQKSVDASFSTISSLLGGKGINLLINNAGVLLSWDKPSTTSADDFFKTFDVNVAGTHRVTLKFAPMLYSAAEQNPSVAIGCHKALCLNISSNMGSIENTTQINASSYSVSKAALNMLTRVTSIEFLDKGVLCCSVHPGTQATCTQTEMCGPNVTLRTKTSVDGLMKVIENALEEHSGLMLDTNMTVMPF